MAKIKKIDFTEELKEFSGSKKKKLFEKIGKFTADQIRKINRSGKQPIDNGGRPGHHSLEPSTIRNRKRLAVVLKNETHRTYKANRSNLTFSGQLLDAITHHVNARGNIVIEIADTIRKPYKTSLGKRKSKGGSKNDLTNADLQAHLNDMDREPLAIDDELVDQLVNKVDTFLSQQLKKIRKI